MQHGVQNTVLERSFGKHLTSPAEEPALADVSVSAMHLDMELMSTAGRHVLQFCL